MFRIEVRMAGTVVFIEAEDGVMLRGRSNAGDVTAAERLRRKRRLMSK